MDFPVKHQKNSYASGKLAIFTPSIHPEANPSMRSIRAMAWWVGLASAAQSVHAAPTCPQDLRELIVPAMSNSATLKGFAHAQADIPDPPDEGVYSVRLFVPADRPDSPGHEVSIGWVNLDTRAMKVFDITRAPEQPEPVLVDQQAYRRFVEKCLRAGR